MAVVFSIIGFIFPTLFTVLLIWLVVKGIKRQNMLRGQVSQTGQTAGQWGMLRMRRRGNPLVSALILVVTGGIFLAIAGVNIFYNYITPRIWEEVPAQVTDSQMESYHRRKGGRRYTAVINYTYQIEGQSYSGRYDSSRAGAGSSRSIAEERLARYLVGSTVSIRVNPKNLRQSVLPEKLGESTYFPIGVGLFFLGLGLLSLRSLKKKKMPPPVTSSPPTTLSQIPKGTIPPPILK